MIVPVWLVIYFFGQDQIQILSTVVSDMLSAWNSGSISSFLFEKQVNYIIRLGNVEKDSLFSKKDCSSVE